MSDICGKPLIQHIIERLKRCNSFSCFVILTSENDEDDILADLAADFNIKAIRGSEINVLSRFVRAQKKFDAEHIIRICADNPAVDPVEVDRIVYHHLKTGADYSFNNVPSMGNQYPDGLGAEIFTAEALLRTASSGKTEDDIEHVNNYILEHPDLFKIETIQAPKEIAFPSVKLDIDTLDDLVYMRKVFSGFVNNQFSATDLINYVTSGTPSSRHMQQHETFR